MADGARRPEGGPTRKASTARKLLWAVVGAVVYVAAKYIFGF